MLDNFPDNSYKHFPININGRKVLFYLQSYYLPTMSQITLIAIVLSCALAVVAPQETFKAWKQKYNKVYSAKSVITEAQAQKAFAINAAKVAAHNSDPTATYKLGLNANSDVVQDDSSVKGKYVLNETATPENLKKSQQASPMPTGSKQSSKTKDINLKMSWPTSVDYSADFPPVKSIGTCLSGDMTSSGESNLLI